MAVSDPTGFLASPLTTLDRLDTESDISSILRVSQEQEVSEIVAGLPLSLNGQVGAQAKTVRYLIKALVQKCPVPVKTWDERYSTKEAERLLREAGHRPSRDKPMLDAASAAVILQSYLDSLRLVSDTS